MGKSSINGPISTAMLNNQRVPLETLKDTQIMYGPVSENGSLPGPMAYPPHWNRHKMVVINPFGWYECEMGNIHINISISIWVCLNINIQFGW